MKIKDLIKVLSVYNENTDICHNYIDDKNSNYMGDFVIEELHPIGDRDAEDLLLLCIKNKEIKV